jgi:predicted  nucleic acid-binding Zn-ribbon protein
MTEQPNTSGNSFLQSLGRFLRFLVRLLLVFVIGALIGLGLYYGVPWLYRRLVLPVQENRARVAVLEDRVEQQQERITENHRALQGRMVELETNLAELQEEVAGQGQDQEALEEQSQALAQRVAQLESDLEGQEQDIAAVESDLEDTASALSGGIDAVRRQLEDTQAELNQQIEATEGRLDEVETQVGTLTGQLALLQTAQDLLKVRLHLLEENTGAARETVDLAAAHLDRAGELMPSRAETLGDLRERVLALDELIAQGSFRVRPSLEALWADVMDLAVPLTAQSTVTATQPTSPLPTPTPTLAPTSTLTPTSTVTPTPAPTSTPSP